LESLRDCVYIASYMLTSEDGKQSSWRHFHALNIYEREYWIKVTTRFVDAKRTWDCIVEIARAESRLVALVARKITILRSGLLRADEVFR